MTVAIIAGVGGLLAVLVAFYRDAEVEEPGVRHPQWDLLPDPSDVARTEFPLAFPGYEPATVEFHFDLLTRAYADLLAEAGPDAIARARHRAALRRGVDLPVDARGGARPRSAPPTPAPRRSVLAPRSAEGADAEALRAEAALADLDAPSDHSR